MSRINDIIDKYQGGNEFLSDEDQDYLYENNLFDELENSIIYCNRCCWWNEAHDMHEGDGDGDICGQCKEEEEDGH